MIRNARCNFISRLEKDIGEYPSVFSSSFLENQSLQKTHNLAVPMTDLSGILIE